MAAAGQVGGGASGTSSLADPTAAGARGARGRQGEAEAGARAVPTGVGGGRRAD